MCDSISWLTIAAACGCLALFVRLTYQAGRMAQREHEQIQRWLTIRQELEKQKGEWP